MLRNDYLEERSVENSQLFKANNIGVIYKNLENENVQKIGSVTKVGEKSLKELTLLYEQ